LPSGLILSSKGVIKGTPISTSSGVHHITVQVNDGVGIDNQDFSITIYNLLVISALEDATVGMAYSQTLSTLTSGGSGNYKFKIVGALPSWLKFTASTGTISGTPVSAGKYPFDIKVTDSLKGTITKTVNIIVNNPE
jgi:large repetitive protein